MAESQKSSPTISFLAHIPNLANDPRKFETYSVGLSNIAFVAQGIEHWFPVPKVGGSNPLEGTDLCLNTEMLLFLNIFDGFSIYIHVP